MSRAQRSVDNVERLFNAIVGDGLALKFAASAVMKDGGVKFWYGIVYVRITLIMQKVK